MSFKKSMFLKSFFLISAVVLFVFLPILADAALVPECLGTKKGGAADGSDDIQVAGYCTICDLFVLIQNILRFAWIYIAMPLAALMLAYGGFMMLVPGVSGEKGAASVSKGKKIITNTLIGIAIVFLAWLGIDTIIKTMGGFQYGGDSQFGFWNQINCTAAPITIGGGDTGTETGTETGTGTGPLAGKLSHAQALSQLNAAGINVTSSGNCSDKNNKNCTSLDGIQQSTINEVIRFKNSCAGCTVTITGGTEIGHEAGGISHATGRKIDIDATSQIRSYITNPVNRYTDAGIRASDGAKMYRAPNGAIYADEGNHFDIVAPL